MWIDRNGLKDYELNNPRLEDGSAKPSSGWLTEPAKEDTLSTDAVHTQVQPIID